MGLPSPSLVFKGRYTIRTSSKDANDPGARRKTFAFPLWSRIALNATRQSLRKRLETRRKPLNVDRAREK